MKGEKKRFVQGEMFDQSTVLTEPQLTLWDAQEQLLTIRAVLSWLNMTWSLESYVAQSLI